MERNFVIGSPWIYYKIYTGFRTADTLLIDIIKPISEKLIESKLIDKWFFIRYSDPDHHLRIRFHCVSTDGLGEIISNLYCYLNKYVNQGLIWKVQIDTYERELKRYGVNTIEVSEELFYHDSNSVVDIIRVVNQHNDENLRWLIALKAIDFFLDGFKYSVQKKKELLVGLSQGFLNEYGNPNQIRKEISKKYRVERNQIERILHPNLERNPEYSLIEDILNIKNKEIEYIARQILEYEKNNTLEVSLNSLISSFIHMTMNRIFKSQNRKHESVCYDLLAQYYKSLHARKIKGRLSKA